MALKYQITQEEFDELEEAQQQFYVQSGEGYQLDVEGIDDGAELKEALRKEREERAAAKKRTQELEQAQSEAERQRLEEQQQYQELYQKEQEARTEREKELQEMRDQVANEKRNSTADGVVKGLTRDTARADLLRKEALQFIAHTPEGVKINGPDGDAWDAKKLSEHLEKTYPFLVDGSGATGGGATGSNKNGGAVKTFGEYTGAELKAIKDSDPDQYTRLRDEYYRN